MKKVTIKYLVLSAFAALTFFTDSCTKDLLKQDPTVDMGSASFWKTETDATTALMGAYSSIRPLFDRDYY
jgi:starch-binding outer membrane protein, SusD/RagB family